MCYESPTKFSCFRCGNEWSDKVTQAFTKKMILCDNFTSCTDRFSPTSVPPVAQYSAHMCDLCYLSVLTEKANEMGAVAPADLLSLVKAHRKEREAAARLWAVNMRGSPSVYFGVENALADADEEKRLLDEIDKAIKKVEDEKQTEKGKGEVYIKQEPGEPEVYINQEPDEPDVYIKQEPEER